MNPETNEQTPETALVSPSAPADTQLDPETITSPETPIMEPETITTPEAPIVDAETEADFEGSFVAMLKAGLETTTDPEERDALEELIGLVEENPAQEQEFIQLFVGALSKQLKDAFNKPTIPTGPEMEAHFLALQKPIEEPAEDSEDARIVRIKAQAQAELDIMMEASRIRQKVAEAAAAAAEEARQEA